MGNSAAVWRDSLPPPRRGIWNPNGINRKAGMTREEAGQKTAALSLLCLK